MKLKIYSILILLLVQTGLGAGNSKSTGFQFLNTIYSPKFKALGGPYPSLLGDVNGILINPSGLAFISNQEVLLNYTNYLLDFKGGLLAYAYPLKGLGSISGGLVYFDYGEFEEVNRFALATGRTFVSRDISFLLSFAGQVNRIFSYGITMKYIYSQIDSYSSAAIAVDAGITYRMEYLDNLVIGLAARNLGKSLSAYDQIEETLPRNISIGLSKKIPSIPLIVHTAFNNVFLSTSGIEEFYYNFSIGLEAMILDPLELRLGYNNDLNRNLSTISNAALSGFSMGFGLYLGAHRVDYAYASYGDLGATHFIGLSVDIDDLIAQESPVRSEMLPAEKGELVPPSDIRVKIISGRLVISWEKVPGYRANVYARIEGQSDWKKLNPQPLKDNFMSFKKPGLKGTYLFRITSVSENAESRYSDEQRIQIE
jgi:hypothetical protein